MHESLSEAGAYVNPWLKLSLESAASGLDSIGIGLDPGGVLQFDEAKLKPSLNEQSTYANRATAGIVGLAQGLLKAADRIRNTPPSVLLNTKSQTVQFFAAYQPSRRSYYQMPVIGLVFDGAF